jgi:hypothetical protein
MTTPEGNQSEVARIRQQIEAERESAQRAMNSPAYGSATHLFITKRMERIGGLHEALKEIVGKDAAVQILSEALDKGQKPKGETE